MSGRGDGKAPVEGAEHLITEVAAQLIAADGRSLPRASRDLLRRMESMQIELLGHIRSRDRQIERLQRHALSLRQELDGIYGSVSWRAAEATRRRILRLGPQGTRGYNWLMKVRRLMLGAPAPLAMTSGPAMLSEKGTWLNMPADPNVRDQIDQTFSRIRGAVGKKRVVIVKSGGVGDNIQAIPVLAGIRRRHPDAVVVIVVERAASIFAQCPFVDAVMALGRIDQRVKVRSAMAAAHLVYDVRYVSWAYGDDREVSPYAHQNRWLYDLWPQSSVRLDILGEHVSQIMLKSFGLEDLASVDDMRVEPQATPLVESIAKPYVVVTNAVDSSVGTLKKWPETEWLTLIQALTKKGVGIVQLGARADPLLSPLAVDFRSRTNLREAAHVLKASIGYIGVEGGLFHLARAVGARGFVLFASTPPLCFSYPDTVVLSRTVCPPCWWQTGWEHGICSRGAERCFNLPDAEEVIAALEAHGI